IIVTDFTFVCGFLSTLCFFFFYSYLLLTNLIFFFFFLLLRLPPRSTLFPTRRSSDLDALRRSSHGNRTANQLTKCRIGRIEVERSEEHTSELQSPDHLVCRLLLEKKNKQQKHMNIST